MTSRGTKRPAKVQYRAVFEAKESASVREAIVCEKRMDSGTVAPVRMGYGS